MPAKCSISSAPRPRKHFKIQTVLHKTCWDLDIIFHFLIKIYFSLSIYIRKNNIKVIETSHFTCQIMIAFLIHWHAKEVLIAIFTIKKQATSFPRMTESGLDKIRSSSCSKWILVSDCCTFAKSFISLKPATLPYNIWENATASPGISQKLLTKADSIQKLMPFVAMSRTEPYIAGCNFKVSFIPPRYQVFCCSLFVESFYFWGFSATNTLLKGKA